MAKSRFVALDAMRGIAALCIVWFHTTAAGGTLYHPRMAYLAVDLFFMLSGFVLERSYGSRLINGLGILQFMRIRAIRLGPLYVLGIIVGSIHPLILIIRGDLTTTSFLKDFTFNLFLLPAPSSHLDKSMFPINIPAWSLFFEFYIANLIYALARKRLSKINLTALVVISGIALLLMSLHNMTFDAGSSFSGFLFGMMRTVFGFFCGVTLQRIRSRFTPRTFIPIEVVYVLLPLLLCAPLIGSSAYLVSVGAIYLIFPGLIFFGAHEYERRPRVGAVLGDISYSIYAVHFPILQALSHFVPELDYAILVVMIGAICVLAYALHHLDEAIRAYWRWRPAPAFDG